MSFLMLAVAAVLPGAHGYTGPAVAQFHWPLTDLLVARVEAVVGYPCTEMVPPRGLLLFVTPALAAALRDTFPYSLASITPLDNVGRCSPALSSFGQRGEFADVGPLPRAHLTAGSFPPPNAPSGVPDTTALRVTLHPGALEGRAAEELAVTPSYWRSMIAAALTELPDGTAYVLHDMTPSILVVDGVAAAAVMDVAMHVAAVACVCYVEPVYPARLLNLWGHGTAQALTTMPDASVAASVACGSACTPFWEAGIRGQGQLVAVSDTGTTPGMCMFVDGDDAVPFAAAFSPIPLDTGHRKIRAYWRGTGGDYSDGDGHGTHVTGTACGAAATPGSVSGSGLRAGQFEGVAPEARLVFIDVQTGSGGLVIPAPYDSVLLQYAWNAGARIHSGSWGISDWQYSSEDREIDVFCWSHRSFLAVFAAGNSGATRPAGSILSPALAKNALAVGAALPGFTAFDIASGSVPSFPADTYAYDWIADFSSRGGGGVVPWLKPEILGHGGPYVWSANADSTSGATCGPINDVILGMAGTSMAAPQVAGAAALVRQFFMDRHEFEPMASLLKAVLAASALPSRGVFPAVPMATAAASSAFQPYGALCLQGHGRFSLDRVLHLGATHHGVVSNEGTALTHAGDLRQYCLAFENAAAAELNVTVALSWTDYPSSLVSSPVLVNDLDLRVSVADAASGVFVNEYLPPNGLAGRDSRSTMEVVRIAGFLPASQRLQVRVSAFALGFSEQSFSLLVAAHDAGEARLLADGLVLSGPDTAPFATDPLAACLACGGGIFSHVCSGSPPTTAPPSLPPPPPATPKPPTPIPTTPKPTTPKPTTPQPTPVPSGPATCGWAECLDGGGVSVPDGGCVQACRCLPGWAGVRCDGCAGSTQAGVTPLCVGLAPAKVPANLAGRAHVLALVASGTVAARKAGTFYAAGQGKAADQDPGEGLLDCWCLPAAISVPLRPLTGHSAFAAAALAELDNQRALLALALPDPAAAPPPPATPKPTPKPTFAPPPPPTPVPTSGVGRTWTGAVVLLPLLAAVLRQQ